MNLKVIKNWSILSGSNIFGQILGMLATMYIARKLDPDGYGYFTLVMVYADIGVIVASLGINQILVRELARSPEKTQSYIKYIALAQFFASVPVAIAIIIQFSFIGEGLTNISFASVGLLYCVLVWQLFFGIASSQEQFVFPAMISLLERVSWLILVFLIPEKWVSLDSIALAFVTLGVFKSLLIVVLVYRKKLIVPFCVLKVDNLVVKALPLYWVGLLTLAGTQLPVLFLSILQSATEVGFFSASLKLIQPIQMMILVLMTVLMPGLARHYGDVDKFNLIIKKSIITLVMLGSVASFIVTVFDDEIIYIIFGAKYAPSAQVLSLQIWYTTFVAVFNLIGTALIAADKQNKLGLLVTLSAIVNVPVLWFSSYYGAQGLAIGFLVAGTVNMLYHWPIFQKALNNPFSVLQTLALFSYIVMLFLFSQYFTDFDNLLIKFVVCFVILLFLAYFVYRAYLQMREIKT